MKAAFCNACGNKMIRQHLPRNDDGRMRLYADIAHPINAECREFIHDSVLAEYEAEVIKAQEPGYVSRYEAFGDE